jgi:hypothetical protein
MSVIKKIFFFKKIVSWETIMQSGFVITKNRTFCTITLTITFLFLFIYLFRLFIFTMLKSEPPDFEKFFQENFF